MASGHGNVLVITAVGMVMLGTGLFVGWWIPKESEVVKRVSNVDSKANRKICTERGELTLPGEVSAVKSESIAPDSAPSRDALGEPGACPSCPEPIPCESCPVCSTCPDSSSVCADCVVRQRVLTGKLKEREQRLEKLEKRMAGLPEGSDRDRRRYVDTTALERRQAAAGADNLLLEFPAWGEDTTMGPEDMERLGLTPDDTNKLAELYRGFQQETFGELQDIYAEMMGDPDAGMDSTVNGLFHNIASQSPGDECKQQMAILVSALSSGIALTVPSATSHPCARAFYLLMSGVDSLEGEVRQEFGEGGVEGLWRGASSFVFSTESN